MPSKLVGLVKSLAWTDFQGQPDPAKPKIDAFTSATFVLPTVMPQQSGGTWQYGDNVTVTITMNNQRSWRRQQGSQGVPYWTDLLKHEQGHYDIVALIARDLFIDVMQLKGNTYATNADALNDLRPIINLYSGKQDKISKIYDSTQQTNHGANAMIRRAFTEPRNPAMSAPDGTPYKVKFLDVLGQNGINP
jgi:hypothetical protein